MSLGRVDVAGIFQGIYKTNLEEIVNFRDVVGLSLSSARLSEFIIVM